MGLKIKLGARIIENMDAPATTDYGATKVWEVGDVLTITSTKLVKATDSTTATMGLAMERRAEPVNGDTSMDGTYHGYGSILTGEAVVLVDRIASGISFDENDAIYVDANGQLTDTGTYIVGCVRKVEDADGYVEIFWKPPIHS